MQGQKAMTKILSGCAGLLFLAAATPTLAGEYPFIAEIMIFAGNFCPRGYAAMNGQLLPINQNQALFSLLGTNYGGDGRVNFGLPTAKPIFTATGATMTQCIALQGIFPSRN